MKIDLLEDFVHVAKRQNITKSAAEIHTSQPALSVRISSLEKELGCELFTRTNSGIELNESGRVFLSYAQKIIDLYHEGVQKCYKARKLNPIRLYMDVNSGLLDALPPQNEIPYRFIELGINEPAVDAIIQGTVDVALDSNYSLIPELNKEAIDTGILYFPLANQKASCFIAMMKTHPLASKAALSHADFQGQTIVINSGAHFDRWSKAVQYMIGDDIKLNFKMNQFLSYTDVILADYEDAIYICGSSASDALARRTDVAVYHLVNGEPITFPSALICREQDYKNPYSTVCLFIQRFLKASDNK
ncbi:MAG: LysR family transcriptional regulator [Coriobacteriales bacterium]|nr:LysR family transcriptional regulator [Coriobacteriales bacterium]